MKLKELDLSWNSRISVDIIPFIYKLCVNGQLNILHLYLCNRFITFYYAFKSKIKTKLKRQLIIIGGLQQETMQDIIFNEHINTLKSLNIIYKIPTKKCLSQYFFERKLELLLKAKLTNNELKYRIFSVPESIKVYLVFQTQFGLFGIKIKQTDLNTTKVKLIFIYIFCF